MESLINIYEVVDSEGTTLWAGENQNEAVAFFTRDMLNRDMKVTPWYAEGLDARPAGDKTDITPLVLAAIASGRVRG